MNSKRKRVVWSEGLLLTPQHLQQQDRYHEEYASALFRAARPFGSGYLRLNLDQEAIRNGRIALLEAEGVLPGGTPFSIPEQDPIPIGLRLEDRLAPTETNVPVYLGLRVHREGEPELTRVGSEASDRRYRETTGRLADMAGDGEEREVPLADTNLRLLFQDEKLGDYDALPLGEVVRRPDGGFAYREDFVPPCLAVSAAPPIMQTLRRLTEILVAKSTELCDRRRMSGRGAAEFGRDDTAALWQLGVVNGAIPLLSHYLRTGVAHPEEVYRCLAVLAGNLTALSEIPVRSLPVFDHSLPGLSILELGVRIPELLDVGFARNYVRIPLTPRDAYISVGRIQDDRWLDASVSFFLGVTANQALSDLQADFPELAKVASPDRIDFLVAHALKGVPLRLTQNLPAALPVQGGFVYFLVDRGDALWEGIAASRSFALYSPPEFPGAKFELIAVRE